MREGTVLLQLAICCYTVKAGLLFCVEKGGYEYSCSSSRILQICISVVAQVALL